MTDLLTESRGSRKTAHTRPEPTTYGMATDANREAARIVRLARTAIEAAAREHERHRGAIPRCPGCKGRDDLGDPCVRCEATAELLSALYAGDRPDLERLTDSDRPEMPARDGEATLERPSGELLSAANRALHRSLPTGSPSDEPGTSILELSTASREDSHQRRSIATQLDDPSADPLPPEVADSLDAAHVWPADPIRVAVAEQVCDPCPTVEDLTVVPMGSGKTRAAVAKALQRGRVKLAAGCADTTVATFANHLRTALVPTDGERAEAARAELASMAGGVVGSSWSQPTEAETGGAVASLIDTAWRTTQPMPNPVTVRHMEMV